MKKYAVLFYFFFVSFLSFADCFMFLGGNYSATLKADYKPIHAGGINYTVEFDWGKYKGLYLCAGVVFGSDSNTPNTPYNFDFSGYSAFVSGLGLRVGYPFKFDVSDVFRLSLVPALTFDATSLRGDFSDNKIKGDGVRAGIALVLSARHKLGSLYLRYGAEFELCCVSAITYKYTHSIYNLPDGEVTAFKSGTISPFLSLGWRV